MTITDLVEIDFLRFEIIQDIGEGLQRNQFAGANVLLTLEYIF